jgi:RNA polymerase sigma-70 factor (ECF subfamily)
MSTPKGKPSTERPAVFAEEAVQRYADLLRSFLAHHLRRPQDVDDAAQQVYLRLLRMSCTAEDIIEPLAFIYGVARKVLTDHWAAYYREARRFPSAGEAVEVCADLPSEGLSDNLEDALDLQQQLLVHLKELPPMHAACMVLFHRDQMTQEEVAVKLDLAPATVKKYLTEGRARLRKRLADQGIPG